MNYLRNLTLTIIGIFICANGYSQSWKIYADSARLFREQKNLEKAISYYQLSKQLIIKNQVSAQTEAIINDSLGFIYTELQQYKQADTCFQRSFHIRKEFYGTDSLDYAQSCYNLGSLYSRFLSRYKEAEILLEDSRNIRGAKLGKTDLDYAQSCHYLAGAKLSLGKREEALNLYVEAKDIKELRLGRYNIEYAKTLFNIGNVYSDRTDNANALITYTEAKQIFDSIAEPNNRFSLGASLNIAMVYFNLSQFYQAKMILLDKIDKFALVCGKSSYEYNNAIGLLGQVYREIGEYQEAEKYFLESLDNNSQKFGKESIYYAASCWNLGVNYLKLGQYGNAEIFLIQSKQIREKTIGKNNMAYAASCDALAQVYMITGKYDHVEELLLECKSSMESVAGDNFSNTLLGQYYYMTGQLNKSLTTLEHGKEILERNKLINTEYYQQSVETLSLVYLGLNMLPQSKSLLAISLDLAEKLYGRDHMKYANLQKYLGEVYWMEGKYDSAYLCYKNALDIYNNEMNKVFRFTNEEEKTSYVKMLSGFQNSFLSFNYNSALPGWQGMVYDYIISNRNLSQSSFELLKNYYYNTSDIQFKSKFNDWLDTRKKISYWYSIPLANRPAELIEMEAKAKSLEKELTAAAYASNEPPKQTIASWKTIKAQLKNGEVAIEFASFRYIDPQRISDSTFYMALVLRKDMPYPQLVRLFESKQLDSLLLLAGSRESGVMINSLYNRKSSMYRLVWAPLENYLAGVTKVNFSVTGDLHKISFAALPVNEHTLLMDKYQLSRLNSTASVLENNTGIFSGNQLFQLYGGINYSTDTISSIEDNNTIKPLAENNAIPFPDMFSRGSGFQFLPGTRQEVEMIKNEIRKKGYPVTLLMGEEATEESLKVLNGNASPEILHIATHGFFFPDPALDKMDVFRQQFEKGGMPFKRSENPLLRSGLLFSGANIAWKGKQTRNAEDGILTAYEISNLYFPNTRLVVLSACETALGDIQGNEGVYGLQRAFKMAGVRYLVMSLWKVPDAESSEFMQLFYKYLFLKKDVNISFQQAQREMKNKYEEEPYKWAAWILLR